MVHEILARLLHAAGKQVTSWDWTGERLRVSARSVAKGASCPACGRRSNKRHGHYWRHLAEFPCFSFPVLIEVEVLRFRCSNPSCPRRTFAERIDALAAPRQRCTKRLAAARRTIGLALGGQAGARLAAQLGMGASGDTLLRTMWRAKIDVGDPAPTVIGIDDWAQRRGHRYGTLVVDLERHRPIELLTDREADTVVAWLRGQPGVQIIARDRAGAYAEAAHRAAPTAVQVADRWHLLSNLRDTIERLLSRHSAKLRDATQRLPSSPNQETPSASESYPGAEATPPAVSATGLRHPPAVKKRIAENRERRLARYEQVIRRHTAGQSIRAIATAVGMDRRTVRKFVQATCFPERAPRRPGVSSSSAIHPYIEERAAAGCLNAMQIWRELAANGSKVSYRGVQRAVAALRGCSRGHSENEAMPKPASPEQMPVPSPRRVCGWIFGWDSRQPEAQDDASHAQFVTRLCELEPGIKTAQVLALRLVEILRQQDLAGFDQWLVQTSHCAVAEMRRFAKGIEADLEAVRAAVTSVWSSGQVEGQINRLKFLKRQMYGRAKFDLLRIRVLSRLDGCHTKCGRAIFASALTLKY